MKKEEHTSEFLVFGLSSGVLLGLVWLILIYCGQDPRKAAVNIGIVAVGYLCLLLSIVFLLLFIMLGISFWILVSTWWKLRNT